MSNCTKPAYTPTKQFESEERRIQYEKLHDIVVDIEGLWKAEYPVRAEFRPPGHDMVLMWDPYDGILYKKGPGWVNSDNLLAELLLVVHNLNFLEDEARRIKHQWQGDFPAAQDRAMTLLAQARHRADQRAQ